MAAEQDGSADRFDTLLSEITRDLVERLARGEQPRIEEYTQKYPQIAHLIRDDIPAFRLIQQSGAATAASATDSVDHLEGQQLGDYRIRQRIASGGMGVVYEAEQVSLDRTVALKVLPCSELIDEKAVQRFKNEAHATAKLDHLHIVPVYDVGHEGGRHYYAMPLIKGLTLAEVIAALKCLAAAGVGSGSWSIPEALHELQHGSGAGEIGGCEQASSSSPSAQEVGPTEGDLGGSTSDAPGSGSDASYAHYVADLGLQASNALEHAHRRGVIHRDIKPHNLLLDTTGSLWVTDFGLAKDQSNLSQCTDSDLAGTIRYLAPEQVLARREVLDHRVDIYALGATLYELLSLRSVFDARDEATLLKQVAFDDPKPLRHHNRDVPPDLEAIVLKALTKDPRERYGAAQDLADDLSRFWKTGPSKLDVLHRCAACAGSPGVTVALRP